MPKCLGHVDGLTGIVAAYWRLCLLDYLAGPEKAGRHYWTARKELQAVGWIDTDGRLLVEAPGRDRRRERRKERLHAENRAV